jgi:hypothetical protein
VDPITLLAAASAVWNGIKKASEFAQEAEGVWSQLSKYAGLADQLEQHITTAKNKPQKPKLFGKLDLNKDTQEAFNVFEAEHKLACRWSGKSGMSSYTVPLPILRVVTEVWTGTASF